MAALVRLLLLPGPPTAPVALHLPSAAHADALCGGSPSLASELGLVEQSYDRMIMVKVLAGEL